MSRQSSSLATIRAVRASAKRAVGAVRGFSATSLATLAASIVHPASPSSFYELSVSIITRLQFLTFLRSSARGDKPSEVDPLGHHFFIIFVPVTREPFSSSPLHASVMFFFLVTKRPHPFPPHRVERVFSPLTTVRTSKG